MRLSPSSSTSQGNKQNPESFVLEATESPKIVDLSCGLRMGMGFHDEMNRGDIPRITRADYTSPFLPPENTRIPPSTTSTDHVTNLLEQSLTRPCSPNISEATSCIYDPVILGESLQKPENYFC